MKKILQKAVLFLSLTAVLSADERLQDDSELELISQDELEDFYIDEESTKLILNLLDEDINERNILKAGGIEIPAADYVQNQIARYIAQFTTKSGSTALSKWLDDGEPYRMYVRKQLKKMGMPPALEFLPVVESDYKPNARSPNGSSIGMWQFKENSIHPYMIKTEWLDERLDPWKNTDAALAKLMDNYKMFGDWTISIAAYNCGAGAMKNFLKQSPEKSYWEISEKGLLSTATKNYIPKLLALAAISENQGKFNIFLPEINEKARLDEFDYVQTEKSIDLYRLASELRMDFAYLKKLNNGLIKNCTPPDSVYNLRLPPGMKEAAERAIKDILSSL